MTTHDPRIAPVLAALALGLAAGCPPAESGTGPDGSGDGRDGGDGGDGGCSSTEPYCSSD